MGLGERCDEIVQLIDRMLAEVGVQDLPAPVASDRPASRRVAVGSAPAPGGTRTAPGGTGTTRSARPRDAVPGPGLNGV
jgi:hypothetical protein